MTSKSGDLFDRMDARVKELTPKKGFNLVGVDKFEQPGDELYLVKNFDTRAEAEAALKKEEKAHPRDAFHVYRAPGEK